MRAGQSFPEPPPVEAIDPKTLFSRLFQETFGVNVVDLAVEEEEMDVDESANVGGPSETTGRREGRPVPRRSLLGSKGQVVPRERRNSGERARCCGGGPWAAGIRARRPPSCGE
eukprot:1742057-Lingulodinium_polyedra.AAC.1